MKELIKVHTKEDGDQTCSAKELYLYLGYDKSNWKRWSEKNIENNKFVQEKTDWVGFVSKTNGNKTMDYEITIDFAKRIAMMADTQKGHEARTYFIECERIAKEQRGIYQHSSILAKILLDAPTEWRKTFPDEFFLGVHKLYGHRFDRKKGTYSFVGRFINKYIYNHLLTGLSVELKTKRQLQKIDGIKLHQFLETNAKDVLKIHVNQIEALLRVSMSSEHFESLFRNFTQPNQMRLAV